MSRFVPVAQVSELAPGQMKMVVADQERLLLVNMAGTFYVISDACGHDWAPLSRGKLEGHVVICPRHFARYDVRTGHVQQAYGPPILIMRRTLSIRRSKCDEWI